MGDKMPKVKNMQEHTTFCGARSGVLVPQYPRHGTFKHVISYTHHFLVDQRYHNDGYKKAAAYPFCEDKVRYAAP